MTESELMTVMIGGMAHIAGGVMAAYVGLLGGGDPVQQAFYAKHLLAASVMAAPATILIAKILIPETGVPLTRGDVRVPVERTTANVIDAAAGGAADGLKLALNVGAMLLAFIALIELVNAPIQWLGSYAWGGDASSSLNLVLSGWAGHDFALSLQSMSVSCCRRSPGDRRALAVIASIAWAGFIGEKIVVNDSSPTSICPRTSATIAAGEPPDRDLCALWLRQLLVVRDPDRWHRRTGGPRAAAIWPGSAWRAVLGGHGCNADDGNHRGRAVALLIPAH